MWNSSYVTILWPLPWIKRKISKKLLLFKCQILSCSLWAISPHSFQNPNQLFKSVLYRLYMGGKNIISIEWYWIAKSPHANLYWKKTKLCHFVSFVKNCLLLSVCVFLPSFNSIITAIQMSSPWTLQMSTQSAVAMNVNSAPLFYTTECRLKKAVYKIAHMGTRSTWASLKHYTSVCQR